MPSVLYVGLQEADKIAVFSIDGTGKLSKQSEVAAPGGPSVMAVSNDHNVLYVGQRDGPASQRFGSILTLAI
jgi:6-phosphogluconolactonase (cycloisomerase 2 family)